MDFLFVFFYLYDKFRSPISPITNDDHPMLRHGKKKGVYTQRKDSFNNVNLVTKLHEYLLLVLIVSKAALSKLMRSS